MLSVQLRHTGSSVTSVNITSYGVTMSVPVENGSSSNPEHNTEQVLIIVDTTRKFEIYIPTKPTQHTTVAQLYRRIGTNA